MEGTQAAATVNRRATSRAGSKTAPPEQTKRRGRAAKQEQAAEAAPPAARRGRPRKATGEQQQQSGGPTLSEALKSAQSHLGGGASQSAAGKLSAGEGTSGKETPPKRRGRKPANDAAMQSGGSSEQQGAGTAGEVRMGAMQVLVVEREVLGRGGRPVSTKEEAYPFLALGISTPTDSGGFKGPSFFLPRSVHPDSVVTAGRKAIKRRGDEVSIITRKVSVEDAQTMGIDTSEPGVLVWKIEGAGR